MRSRTVVRVLSRARGRALTAPSPPLASFASLTPRVGPRGIRGSRTTRSTVPPAPYVAPALASSAISRACEHLFTKKWRAAGVRVARRSGSLAKRGCPGAPPAANGSELQGGEGALRGRPAEPGQDPHTAMGRDGNRHVY